MYALFGKRLLDLLLAIPALILFSPIFVCIAFFIKVMDSGPVFFRQERLGQYLRPFWLYKFRTMVPNWQQGLGITSQGDPRITKIGRVLRKWKLDELPQLWHVFKGEMSFVGPRPELAKYVAFYPQEYQKLLQVKPGLTDYATLVYRNEEVVLNSFQNQEEGYLREILPAKIKLSQKYLQEMSFFTDLKILGRTFLAIIF